jgi:hypothetical protein
MGWGCLNRRPWFIVSYINKMFLYRCQWFRVVSSGRRCRNLGSKKTITEKDTDDAASHMQNHQHQKARNAYLTQTNR